MSIKEYDRLFALTIQSFLGDKNACHIEGGGHSEQGRKGWYQKVLKIVIKKINQIETSTKHQKDLMDSSEQALEQLSEKAYDERVFTFCLLRLIAALLGLSGIRPYNIATPAYFQTPSQYDTEVTAGGGDALQLYFDKTDAVSIRQRVVNQLKKDGLTDFKISLVMNISEYQVRKLKKEA